MNSVKLFPCYSIPMRNYFSSIGIRYELVGLHPETKNMFWVYKNDYESGNYTILKCRFKNSA